MQSSLSRDTGRNSAFPGTSRTEPAGECPREHGSWDVVGNIYEGEGNPSDTRKAAESTRIQLLRISLFGSFIGSRP